MILLGMFSSLIQKLLNLIVIYLHEIEVIPYILRKISFWTCNIFTLANNPAYYEQAYSINYNHKIQGTQLSLFSEKKGLFPRGTTAAKIQKWS